MCLWYNVLLLPQVLVSDAIVGGQPGPTAAAAAAAAPPHRGTTHSSTTGGGSSSHEAHQGSLPSSHSSTLHPNLNPNPMLVDVVRTLSGAAPPASPHEGLAPPTRAHAPPTLGDAAAGRLPDQAAALHSVHSVMPGAFRPTPLAPVPEKGPVRLPLPFPGALGGGSFFAASEAALGAGGGGGPRGGGRPAGRAKRGGKKGAGGGRRKGAGGWGGVEDDLEAMRVAIAEAEASDAADAAAAAAAAAADAAAGAFGPQGTAAGGPDSGAIAPPAPGTYGAFCPLLSLLPVSPAWLLKPSTVAVVWPQRRRRRRASPRPRPTGPSRAPAARCSR